MRASQRLRDVEGGDATGVPDRHQDTGVLAVPRRCSGCGGPDCARRASRRESWRVQFSGIERGGGGMVQALIGRITPGKIDYHGT